MYNHFSKSDQKREEPITPVAQYIPSFPTSSRARRASREPSTTTCSSSSSLYETDTFNYDNQNSMVQSGQHGVDVIGNSSALHSYSSDEDSNTDTDLDLDLATTRLSERKSQELFRQDWDDIGGSHSSPTFTKQKKTDDYFSPKENTPIFKRLISKNSLKPQLKSFRRITAELQHESVPLENEINHEKLILLNLQDEEHFLNKSRFHKNEKTIKENNHSYKKFDIIKRANESWNSKKHGFLKYNDDADTDSKDGESIPDEENLVEVQQASRKRSFSSESVSKSKRRAVSTSPISTGFLKRGNFKLISNASMDLENMSLE